MEKRDSLDWLFAPRDRLEFVASMIVAVIFFGSSLTAFFVGIFFAPLVTIVATAAIVALVSWLYHNETKRAERLYQDAMERIRRQDPERIAASERLHQLPE
ncbi:MAG: hypothetical protein KDA53_12730 [Hyphomonas sp.]|nr:hypothetical protein [Hyphomonas sp.]